MESFEDKLKRICETRSISLTELCERAGIKYGTLHQQLRRNSRISLEMAEEICHVLDVPLSYFSRRAPSVEVGFQADADAMAKLATKFIGDALQISQVQALRRQETISQDDIRNWLRRTGGRLEDFDAIKNAVDLFHVMKSEDNIPEPYQLGPDSLSSKQFNISCEDEYRSRIGELHPTVVEAIKRGRIAAANHSYIITDVIFRAQINGVWVTDTYSRLTGRVFLPGDRELTLVHAEFVPNIHQSNREATDLDLIEPQASHADDHQEGDPSN